MAREIRAVECYYPESDVTWVRFDIEVKNTTNNKVNWYQCGPVSVGKRHFEMSRDLEPAMESLRAYLKHKRKRESNLIPWPECPTLFSARITFHDWVNNG
jgi:hypothetical protein